MPYQITREIMNGQIHKMLRLLMMLFNWQEIPTQQIISLGRLLQFHMKMVLE